MTQAGGPAAINGFLYQILHHIEWIADVKLEGKLADQEVKNALLVLEPRNGGDARAEAPDQYLVEQYKTRTNGTWSLKNIENVLRNLRNSVRPSLPANAHYRFVTDGRAGRLEEFNAFLDALKSVKGPDHLNNDKKRKFRNGLTVTDHEFFDHIVEETRNGNSQQDANERTLVFHLLSRFEMVFCVTDSGLIEKIERRLRPHVTNLGDEYRVRHCLVGLLMDRLRRGETHLKSTDIDGLLQEADPDLNIERLRKLKRLSETMAELSRDRLGHIGYRHEKDVREVPCWPEGKPVLLITGESGAGKTWQLGKYLEECVEASQIATLVGAKTTEDILTRAARDIWQSGLGETSEKSLIAVSNFLSKIAPNIPIPLLTVAVDDIQVDDIQVVYVARDLIRQDWMKWGMRLILTVPNTVASALEHTDSETIHVHRIGDFSIDELDALLKQHGQQWAALPSDLKRLLCKPILAGIYLELFSQDTPSSEYRSFQDAPCSEYEIFEKFWEKMVAQCQPGDEGIVTALAAHTHEGKSYPLPRPKWQRIGLDDESFARLQAVGWLRSPEDGKVEFVHDRLLNWAVAKSLARKFQREELSIDELYDILFVKSEEQEGHQLGYVPMDTFWLLAVKDTHSKDLGQLVAKINDYTLEDYIDLLPTLGQRSVPILLELLNRVTSDSDYDYKVSLIGKALANLAQQEKIELGDTITKFLNTSYRPQQSVAIAVLEAVPEPCHLDRLWELHQQRADARNNKSDWYNRADYQASFAALRAGIELDPEWLRNRILAADKDRERIVELGYLLSGLEHPDAPAIWQDTSDVLMSRLSPNKPRSLINCIERFEDHEKINFVIEHLSCSEDSASGAAIRALTILAPQEAIDRLIEVEENDRYLTRNEWLPHLLRVHPEQTRQRILELAQSDSRGYWLITSIFWERPNELNEAMLRFVLRTLESDLRNLREAFPEDPPILNNPLDFLGRIACPKLLKILQEEAGGELERLIVEVALSRLHTNNSMFDHIRENARRILMLIGGQGITTLINRELSSEHFWVRYGGLKWAFVRADDSTIEQLAAIAKRPIPRDANGKPESGSSQEFCQAITALAVLGADLVLVEILMQTDAVDMLPIHLATLRAHRGPMPKALTNSALQMLQDTALPEDLLQTYLVIAWLSGDADFIPIVRTVLRTVLERAEPESQIANYACIALQRLGDQSDDFARLAEHLAQTKANADWGLNALIGLKNKGLKFLQNWIQSPSNPDYIGRVIRTLYHYAETRDFAVDAAVHRCLNSCFTHHPLYDIAAESDNPDLRKQILEVAFAERAYVAIEPLRAIQGLAKFDVARAVEAIEQGLQFHPNIERDLCLLLVSLAPEAAAKKLLESVITIERESLIPAAGRALRQLDPTIVAPSVIERMSIPLSSRRESVAELAGWLPIPEITEALGHLADHDNSIDVRRVALGALERHRKEKMVCSLFANFPRAKLEHQWALLVAILEVADPYLLTDREDSLWLEQIFTEDVPRAFVHHAKAVIEKRK